jgi:hypothetical protein
MRKPRSCPDDPAERAEQECRAYDNYYSGQTLEQQYFYTREAPKPRFSMR